MHKPRKVIYTAMFGGFDKANDPIVDLPGWDMLFFTDAKLKSNKWDIINVPQKEKFDSIQMSRQYKMFPHEYLQDYDLSLWVDASILIRQPIDEFVSLITNDVKMGIYQHTSSWETELSCMYRWTDDIELLEEMKLDYQKDGFDTESKIMSGNVILREHADAKLIEAMEFWWKKFNEYYIKRDQLGLAYSVWKKKLPVNFFPGLHARGDRNPYFKNLEHKKTHRIK